MSMFGALNRFISRLDAEPQEREQGSKGAYGFQVLRNTNQELAIEPWFDFIIGINGRTIDNPDPTLFATEVRNCAGHTISLGVWSAKGQRIREIYVPIPAENPTLGISLQWIPLSSTEDVWHILDVQPNSPADVAGLLPYGDYIIGSPEGLVRGESGLGELVEDYINRPLRLFVYNHEYNVTRPVTITPSRNWGGQGLLGCVLGFGALHRLPAPLEEPPAGPGEMLFDTSAPTTYTTNAIPADLSAVAAVNPAEGPAFLGAGAPPPPSSTSPSFFVPANMHTPPPKSAGSPGPGQQAATHGGRARKTRVHHAVAAGGIEDYFKEGEQKSRELDYGGGGSRTGSVPPPPKAAGPPKGGPPKDATVPVPTDSAPAAEEVSG
ncbi:BTB/POZ domain-containing protein [Macrophomina phaseolina MS6]|uniref:BTB/POZ domain-containing protein n=2 Tax=Macrophomina phaseolina TaxID=35725 RepID=K2QLJ3_MACPH|nr:BTB/POZ domain-containing protein [Macrophomina phaseolina MS6]KAH7039066.1 GRASP55/65 family protein [Macrophomina phaseolina]